MNEAVLSLDNFNRPKIHEGSRGAGLMILRLLLLNPGTNKNHPNMGVGLVDRYRFCSEDDIQKIDEEIKMQMATYLPELSLTDVGLKLVNGTLRVGIEVDSKIYIFSADFGTSEISLQDVVESTQ